MKDVKSENKQDFYAGKISVEDRLLLLFSGMFCFPVGIALYYFFLEKKGKEYHAKFAKMGSTAGMIITFIILLTLLVWTIYIDINMQK